MKPIIPEAALAQHIAILGKTGSGKTFAAKADPRYKKAMARGGRYKRLAELLGIPREECHIGMFDLERCAQAVKICKSGQLEK